MCCGPDYKGYDFGFPLSLRLIFIPLYYYFFASMTEYVELEDLMKPYKVHRYKPSPEFFDQWGDGGIAIIDQIICAHARLVS